MNSRILESYRSIEFAIDRLSDGISFLEPKDKESEAVVASALQKINNLYDIWDSLAEEIDEITGG